MHDDVARSFCTNTSNSFNRAWSSSLWHTVICCCFLGELERLDPQEHTHLFNGPFPGLPGSVGTRKVKPIWILLKQVTVSGIGISWAICKSASCSRQVTPPAPHHSVCYTPDSLRAARPAASKHWRRGNKNAKPTRGTLWGTTAIVVWSLIALGNLWPYSAHLPLRIRVPSAVHTRV